MLKKDGMTFVEILIAFTVIGIVAMLAIPNFMHFEHDKDIVTRLEASRAIITQATKMAETNIGPSQDWDLASMTSAQVFNTYYKPYLQIGKNCTGGAATECWAKTSALTGGSSGGGKYGIEGSAAVSFTMNDGINMTLTKTGVLEDKFGIDTNLVNTIVFMVDVNGILPPNKMGMDVFAFVLTEKGILPAGTDNYSGNCRKGFDLNDDYWDCCASVLKEKKRTYL